MTFERNRLEPPLVAEIVQRQFPELSPLRADYLGEGCDNSAFEINGRWVFRFPKRTDVEEQLLLEYRALPVLALSSPIPLPRFCFHGQPSDAFPRHFGGYEKLGGVPGIQLDPRASPVDSLAPALGRFLSWLHQFPVEEAGRLGVPREEPSALIEDVGSDALDHFERVSQVAGSAPLDEWYEFLRRELQSPPPGPSKEVVVHSDFFAEHVLCAPSARSVTGIIDWSDIAVSDPAVDLAGLFHWGGAPLVKVALAAYDPGADDAVLRRARFLAACRGVSDVAFGLDSGRPEYVDAGIRALGLCIAPG